MSRGKRYSGEQKLNMKKVFAVIITIIVIIMFFIGINKMLKKDESTTNNFTEISYFTMYNNGKWGVINSNGDNVIDSTNGEMIVIPNNKKDIFICLYEVNYSDGTYKSKAVNSKNEQLYTSYNSVEALSNYDQNNNIWYEDNALKVEKDGKYGLINLDGNEILRCEYDKIETIKGIKNSILIQKDGLYGLANASGNIIIDVNYKEISALTTDYTNGYIVKNSEGNLGIVSTNKEQILECKYSDIKHVFGNDMYVVKESGNWKIVNKDGDKNIDINYEDVKSINAENMVVVNKGKYGIYGIDKTEKAKCEYQNIEYAFSDYYIAKKDNKYGIINTNGETLVQFEYDNLKFNTEADCLEGLKLNDPNAYLIDRNLELKLTGINPTVYNGYIRINIDNEYKFYNLKFEEKSNRDVFSNNTLYVAKNDGKYGLVNKEGTLVVQYQYDDITEQNEYGFVAVKKDGKWGAIDQYGNVVVEPKYELSNVSKNSVIGKWHLAENVNTIYYVCE
ncbi:MAG: WG repeat-containing protein [Clostridia bacterium]|nr:WG repeat-containing protein [Clostridia bacterium]